MELKCYVFRYTSCVFQAVSIPKISNKYISCFNINSVISDVVNFSRNSKFIVITKQCEHGKRGLSNWNFIVRMCESNGEKKFQLKIKTKFT